MIGGFLFALLSGNGDPGAPVPPPDPDPDVPPLGPPTNVSMYTYSGSKVGVQWDNADSYSDIRVYRSPSTFLTQQANSGLTTQSWDSGSTNPASLGVSHINDGIETEIVWGGLA